MALTKVSRGLISTSIVDNGNATAITIDSSENVSFTGAATFSGNVGIAGQASPTYKLDGGFADQTWGWYLNSSYNAGFTFNTTERSLLIHTKSAENIDHIKFATSSTGTERMRIDASGNVGIGNSSASGKLEVYANNTVSAAYIRQDGTGPIQSWHIAGGAEKVRLDSGGLLLLNETSSRGTNVVGKMQTQGIHTFTTINNEVAGFVGLNSNADNSLAIGADPDNLRAGSHIIFYMDGLNEKMRLDSSGNLLVGKTASNSTVSGSQLNANGLIIGTTSGTNPLLLNRLSTDGDIAVFQRQGATVGSISAAYSDLAIGNGDTGIHFNSGSEQINPWNMSTNLPRNGEINLGASGARFKDLYLSGGVYLGGTGAANKLDDYEEGTWTPTITGVGGTTSASFTSIRNYYTKVGRLVTLTTYIYNIDYSGITDGTYLVLGNFPFASFDNYGGTALAYANGDVDSIYINAGQDYAYLCNDTNGNEFLQAGTAPTTTKFMATITYFAT